MITQDQYVSLQQPVRPPSFGELFEYERAVLAKKGLAPIGMFDKFAKNPVSGLFILVPPQPAPSAELNWSELMARVELKGKRGQNYLDPKYLTDEIEVPDVPTMLMGVEDGRARLNVSPMDSRENLKREERMPFTTWNGYLLVILFTEVLQHHGLDIVGSRCRAKRVPDFCLYDEKPALCSYWEDYACREWGAPSCGSVRWEL